MRVRATVGEISAALEKVYGRYRARTESVSGVYGAAFENDGAWKELQSLWAGSAAALPLLDYRAVVWVDRRLHVEPSPLGLYLTTPGPSGWGWTP